MKSSKAMKPNWFLIKTLLTISTLLCSCAAMLNSPVTSLGGGENLQVQTVQAEPLYGTNGKNWNDWVENNGSAVNAADDTACDADSQIDGGASDGAYAGYKACIHGGELRKIELPDETDCSELSLSESLGAFDWACDDSGATLYFYTTGLKSGKKLADLLNASSWKSNIVTISKNSEDVYKTEDSDWWENRIYDLTTVDESTLVIKDSPPIEVADNGASGVPDVVLLKTEGSIYTVPTDHATIGYNIQNSKIALVVFDGATLTHASSGNNNASLGGNYTGGSVQALLATGTTRNFVWVEGTFDSNSSGNRTLVFGPGNFYQVRDIEAKNSNHDTMDFTTAKNSRIFNIVTHDSGWTGFGMVTNSNFNFIENIKSYNNPATGFYLATSSNYNRISNMWCSNNNMIGVHISSSYDSVFRNIYAFNNGTAGVQFDAGGQRNTMTNVIAVANGSSGVIGNGSYNTLSHITSINNGADGYGSSLVSIGNTTAQAVFSGNTGSGVIVAIGPARNLFSNIATAENNSYGVYIWSSNDNRITDNLLIGNNSTAQCGVVASTGNNFTSDGGSICGGDDVGTGFSVSDHDAVSLVGEFNGFVSDDDANLHDAALELNGYVAFASLLDWVNFSDIFRVWGKGDNTAFLSDANAGRCTAGNCRLWDVSLDSGSSVLLSQSETGSTANDPFLEGSSCPDAIRADYTVSDQRGAEIADAIGNDDGTCEFNELCEYELIGQGGNDDGICDSGENCSGNNIFLVNALEIMNDGIGDDDGLCESDEACTYSPNFGAYQGHGTLGTEACSFSDGVTTFEVTGVTIYAYPNNGR